jgi:predicted metalloendopeptidase
METKRQVSTMVDKIQSSLYDILTSQTWMDNDTKKAALRKLFKTKKLIGATDYAYQVPKLDKFYENLQLNSSDTLRQMNRKIRLFMSQTKLKNIMNPKQLIGTLELRASTVNAFNMPDENRINILAAILNSPNFNESMPAAINYGAIGVVIGHEFLHSFDTNGVDFDEEGRRRNWWKPDTYSKFRAKAECFIEAYNQTIKQVGKRLDGKLTITENISDNGIVV